MSDRRESELAGQDIRMLIELIGRPAPKLRQQHPDEQVCLAIREMLGSAESLSSGEIVCRIRRLPIPWRHTLLECLNGSEPYSSSEWRPEGVVSIHNSGKDFDYLVRNVRQIPYNPINGKSEPERATYREERAIWSAGETKTLPLSTAIRLLQDHSLQAVPPMARQNLDVRPDNLPLREIGYRITMFDQDTGEIKTYESRGFGKKKAA